MERCNVCLSFLCWTKPEMGEVYELKAQEGDVIVLGTDGLYVCLPLLTMTCLGPRLKDDVLGPRLALS